MLNTSTPQTGTRSSLAPRIDRDQSFHLPVVKPQELVSAARSTKPLGQRLVEAGLLREDQLETALAHQASEEERLQAIAAVDGTDTVGRVKRQRFKRLGEVVAELGLVDEAYLLPMLGEQLGIEGVKLREALIDPIVLRLVPREYAERFHALPLMKVRDELTVAMADPQDLTAIDALSDLTRCKIRPVLTMESGIERLLPRCYEDDFAVDSVTADLDVDQLELDADAIELEMHDVHQLTNDSSAIKLVHYAIIQAVRQGASDIHVEAGQKHASIRFRVDGTLREVMKPRKEMHSAIVSRIKVMAKLDYTQQHEIQDGRLRVRISRRDIDLRVSTLPTVTGEKVVLHVLDRKNATLDLSKLGFSDQSLTRTQKMLTRPRGLVLVTGPAGNGKTTTLYSAMELIKSVERNVIAVEDPVEYQLDLVNQVQVAKEGGGSFAKALQGVLRQDPDVIMIGEIRDRETAEIAIQAAMGGQLVLGSLNNIDGAAAITHLLEMGIEGFKIASSLIGVVAQCLVRNVCLNCREDFFPSNQMLNNLQYAGDMRRLFSRSRGCAECHDTGYRGRTGVFEIFETNSEIHTLITEGADIGKLRAAMPGPTLLSEGIRLAENHVTSLEEVANALPGVTLPGVTLPGVTLPGVTLPGVILPGVTTSQPQPPRKSS